MITLNISDTELPRYTEAEAAKILDISCSTLRRRRLKGCIGHHRDGKGPVRYSMEDIIAHRERLHFVPVEDEPEATPATTKKKHKKNRSKSMKVAHAKAERGLEAMGIHYKKQPHQKEQGENDE